MRIGNYDFGVQTNGLREYFQLGPREAECLWLMMLGKSNKEIAMELGISPHTTDSYKRRIFQKLGVRNATEAAVMAAAVCLGEPEQIAEIVDPASDPANTEDFFAETRKEGSG